MKWLVVYVNKTSLSLVGQCTGAVHSYLENIKNICTHLYGVCNSQAFLLKYTSFGAFLLKFWPPNPACRKEDKINTDNHPGILNVAHQWFVKRIGKGGWEKGSPTCVSPGTGCVKSPNGTVHFTQFQGKSRATNVGLESNECRVMTTKNTGPTVWMDPCKSITTN